MTVDLGRRRSVDSSCLGSHGTGRGRGVGSGSGTHGTPSDGGDVVILQGRVHRPDPRTVEGVLSTRSQGTELVVAGV